MALPPPEQWPQRPLLLRFSPKPGQHIHPAPGTISAVNTIHSTEFETDLFKGRFHLAVRYANNTEVDPWDESEGGEQWLAGKKRKIVVYVQGEFKESLAFDECFFGFVWDRKLAPPRGIATAMSVCEYFSPGTISDITSESEPYLLNLIAGGADAVHIWKPGDPESDKLPFDKPVQVTERHGGDMPRFESMKKRANWMNAKNKQKGGKNASHCHFEPGWTYTFEFYTHLLFMDRFEVHFPLGPAKWKLALEDYFNGQHYPLIGRTKDGRILWNLELWHEKTASKVIDGINAWERTEQEAKVLAAQAATLAKEAAEKAPPAKAPSPVPSSTLEQRIMESSAVGLPPDVGDDDESLLSCNDDDDDDFIEERAPGTPDLGGESDGGQGEDSDQDDGGSPLEAPRSPRLVAAVADSMHGSAPKKNDTRVVLWINKRLRGTPKRSAACTTPRHFIPRGCTVTVLSVQDQWAEVKLPSGHEGWLQVRNLGTNLAGTTPEPIVGQITAKNKRIRSEPVSSKRRHGPYLQLEEEVDVLTVTNGWALIVPTNRPAGWLKLSNMKLLDE